MLNNVYANKKKIYKFKTIKKTNRPRLVKLFKSTRFKKKTEKGQITTTTIKSSRREIISEHKASLYAIKAIGTNNWKRHKNIMDQITPIRNYHYRATYQRNKRRRARKKFALWKYRINYKTSHKQYRTFTSKQYLKHSISKFIQQYFHIKFDVKLTHLHNPSHDKRYRYVCFSLKKDKNKELNMKIQQGRNKIKRKTIKWRKVHYMCVHRNIRRFFVKPFVTQEQTEKLEQSIKRCLSGINRCEAEIKWAYDFMFMGKKLGIIDLDNPAVHKRNALKQELDLLLIKKWQIRQRHYTRRRNFTTKIRLKKKKKFPPVLYFSKDSSMLKHNDRFKCNMGIVYLFVKYGDPQILANYISKLLEGTKKHWQVITQIKNILKNVRGNRNVIYRVGLFGRFNYTEKAKKIYFTLGNMRTQTFNEKVNFAYAQSRPSSGTVGVKIWIYG